jgi:hypothetical protein
MDKQINTAWMWPMDSGGVNGLKIDSDHGVLQWFDEIGCTCDEPTVTQSYAQYREQGPAFPDAPDEVLAELDAAVRTLDDSGTGQ